MRTSATGRIDQAGSPAHPKSRRQRGFSLLELLVALCIVGILASGVSLALPDAQARAREESLLAWRAELVYAARQARRNGEAHAWAWENGRTHILIKQDGIWEKTEPASLVPPPRQHDLIFSGGSVDGQPIDTRVRIVFTQSPPIFHLRFSTSAHGETRQWLLIGQANGVIRLVSAA